LSIDHHRRTGRQWPQTDRIASAHQFRVVLGNARGMQLDGVVRRAANLLATLPDQNLWVFTIGEKQFHPSLSGNGAYDTKADGIESGVGWKAATGIFTD
jgi:hypothetical protein